MLLYSLLASPFLAAILLAVLPGSARKIALPFSLLLAAVITIISAVALVDGSLLTVALPWFVLPGTSATVHFALYSDGLAAWMMLLTSVLTFSSLWVSARSIGDRFSIFASLVFVMQGAIFGCFLASDAVLFFFFFELLVPPAAILIAAFGGPARKRAAILFSTFTLLGSAPMAVALWAIAAWTGTTAGSEIATALGTIDPKAVTLLFWGFAIAFAVKTPLFPFHGWQADSYAEAPAGVTALLSGAMAKVGIFGFLRWTLPLFPQDILHYGQLFTALGVLTVIYGSLVALRQTDMKRVLAFSSLAHLGLAVIGCFTLYQSAIDGVVLMMVAHGLSAGALFLLAALPEQWKNTRNLGSFGGLASKSPLFSALFMIACMAAVAVPGSLGFVAEFLILQGIWQTMGPWIALAAGLSAILSAAYTLRLVQKLLFGKAEGSVGHDAHGHATPAFEGGPEIRRSEALAIVPLVLALFVLGIAPSLVLRSIDPSTRNAPTAVASATSETDTNATPR